MITILPPNATPLQIALEQAVQVPALSAPLRDLWNPDTCPVALLPWLAYELSIPDWSSDWSEAVKRARIKAAIEIHRRKGTKSSIAAIVAALGGNIAISEWWQTTPKGTPHTFTIILSASQNGAPASSDYIQSLIDEVSRTKPVRSHFTFTEGIEFTGGVAVAAILRPATFARLSFQSVG